jgi:hypothetical protein
MCADTSGIILRLTLPRRISIPKSCEKWESWDFWVPLYRVMVVLELVVLPMV